MTFRRRDEIRIVNRIFKAGLCIVFKVSLVAQVAQVGIHLLPVLALSFHGLVGLPRVVGRRWASRIALR